MLKATPTKTEVYLSGFVYIPYQELVCYRISQKWSNYSTVTFIKFQTYYDLTPVVSKLEQSR